MYIVHEDKKPLVVMTSFFKQCSEFAVSLGGGVDMGRGCPGEFGSEGARRIFEPQGKRELSCGYPLHLLPSWERLRGFGSGGSHLDPVGPLPAKSPEHREVKVGGSPVLFCSLN